MRTMGTVDESATLTQLTAVSKHCRRLSNNGLQQSRRPASKVSDAGWDFGLDQMKRALEGRAAETKLVREPEFGIV